MVRISKDPNERKDEIVTTAQQLFLKKGYAKTKVSDIVKAIGVSQGVFYYYFSSKDEVMDEILDRYITLHINEAQKILGKPLLNRMMKMEMMAEAQRVINHRTNQNIHMIKGVDVHERIIQRLISDYVPLMAKAFGNKEDKQLVYKFEVFVAAANILFDPGLFSWPKEERNKRIDFIIDLMEKSVDLPSGSFCFYRNLMGYQ